MTILGLIALAFHLAGLALSVHAVMATRTAQGAIGWAVSLVSFPYVAVPAYLVLGRSKFNGYVTARQQDEVEVLDEAFREKRDGILPFVADLGSEYPGVRAGEKLAEIPVLMGNDAELLIDGAATFSSIFEGIARARDYVLVQFFIVKDDELGRDLQAALIAAANRGVRVLFLYDEVGSNKLPRRYKDELRAAGVQVFNFHTQQGPSNRFQINFRNHRKIVVVDGIEGWVGGHNVGDEYMGRSEKFGRWRDTHVRIEGPAVLALQLSFVEDWHWATGDTPEVSWTPRASETGDIPVLVVPTGPADRWETATLMFTHVINSARRRVWIASPYFVPDQGVMNALRLAALRGVDVRILIPEEPDHLLVYLTAFHFYEEMKDSGITFYRYTDGFMHGKSILVDDAGAVGTANFDNRSFRLNFEITAFFLDPEFTKEVEAMFEEDFRNSRLMTPADVEDKPFWFRPVVRAARLTAPVQ
ncbi:MAG: cardiolipin synthase [marine benthic group bacterium]|nr:cardiolipin synthase [Candidatus Benthicola marisminoris]